MSRRLTIVVPTLGRSAELTTVLAEIERQAPEADLVLTLPGSSALATPGSWRRVEVRGGFAVAVNRAIGAGGGDWIALVNDDAVPEPGWLDPLLGALEWDDGLAAVQGVNLQAGAPRRCDGCGLAWNSLWQAEQILHGRAAPAAEHEAFEVFGVSATAAVYRRRALDEVALAGGGPFDERFGSWYEDVELAVRLRAAGWRASCVPAARLRHRGTTTGRTMPVRRALLLARNRWWAAARLLGRRLASQAPRMLRGDLRSALTELRGGRLARALLCALAPWLALPGLPRYAHRGAALEPGPRAEGFSVGSAG